MVVGYVRVSLDKQALEGVSLEAQRGRIKAWCDMQGKGEPTFFADEGLSGKRADNRPGLQAAIDAACAAKGTLIVYSLSRLARNTRDLLDIAERLDKAGANLVSVTDSIDTGSAMGKFFFTLAGALATLERDLIGERTACAINHLRDTGKRFTRHPPVGYKFVRGKMVEDPDGIVKRDAIRGLLSAGGSLGGTAKALGVSVGVVRSVKRSMQNVV